MIKRQLKLLAFVLAYEVVLVAAFAGLAVLMGGRAYPSYVTVPLWAGFLALFAAPMVWQAVWAGRMPAWAEQVRQAGTSATAEVLANDYAAGKFGYEGPDIAVDIPVRVSPPDGAVYQAKMKVRLSRALGLRPGETVTVKYDAANRRRVTTASDRLF
jgi:hypothetical protein